MPSPSPLPPFVYVMGPSGAGKDAVLRFARDNLPPGLKVAFAHRYITRPATADGENHVALTAAEFEARRAAGLFAFDWRAHDVAYGIGIEIESWRRAGFVVVISGSREHFLGLRRDDLDIRPVLITAAPAIVERRLIARGREDAESVAERLQRGAAYDAAGPGVLVIDNSGPLPEAGSRLVDVLSGLCNP